MHCVILHSLSIGDKVPLRQLANNINITKNLKTGFPHLYSLADAFIKKNETVQPNVVIRTITN